MAKSANNALMEKLKKVTAKAVSQKSLKETDFFDLDKWGAPLDEMIFNIALSGKVRSGGITPGVTVLAGQSKSYKTISGIFMVHAFLEKYKEGICIFYDSEYGGAQYWDMVGVDTSRVMHTPIKNIEELKFDMQKKLDQISEGDKIIFFIDSIGMLASKKEALDALNENAAADMTRAKEIKSFFRIVTSTLNELHIPLVAINNTYSGMDKYNPEVMGGGGGIVLAANTIIFFNKSKHKDGGHEGAVENDLAGHNFRMTIFKSRFIKEGTKLPFRVLYGERGPSPYSGLYDMAVRTGDIYSPSRGWRAARIVDEDGKVLPADQHPKFREGDAFTDKKFWEETMFAKTNFIKNVENRVSLTYVLPEGEEDFTKAMNVEFEESNVEIQKYDLETGEILEDDTEE